MTDRRPVIVVISEDDASRARIVESIARWFATDYRIVEVAAAAVAIDVIGQLRDGNGEAALVIAEQRMPSELGTSLLGRLRDVLPTSRRVVLASWADTSATPTLTRASLLGEIDAVVGWPWSVTDEQFLATIGNLLADWATEHGRYVESTKLLAEPDDPEAQVLRDTVVRWAVPLGFYDVKSEAGRELASRLPGRTELPAILLPDGRVLSRPTIGDIATALGANTDLSEPFDVAIVGSGPAGMAAAVYGVSEGLRTLVIESSALGGQASASPLIRNYLGFPAGISGADLMTRALRQAWTLGAHLLIGRYAVGLEQDADGFTIALDDGSTARTRSVVLAMGVRYRKLGIPSVERLVGRGVFYGAGATEAPGVAGEDVFVVGGGNSGAQATVYLARYARSATLLVRGSSIDDVSEYLVEQLHDRPNIEVRLNTEIVEARGEGRLASLVLRDRAAGATEERPAFAVFVLIGARPRTDWLPASVERDERGFVLTGEDVVGRGGSGEPVPTMRASVPGIFAAGDVRHGSIKRVAASVGEGAAAIREIHEYLAAARPLASATTR
ncbi:MAG TPA: FAD-dependent oxidoreductase [Candidatus Limnocylindrales bacterium]|nr:FAD-dependent oxidoreductase [Candidatus Limnocylindrales bacterium]